MDLKKIAFAILGFGVSTVFAGTMGQGCSSIDSAVPCEGPAWIFGIQALYLKPTYNNHPQLGSFATAPAASRWTDLQPKYSWGFKLEGAYQFSSANDINVNWSHYSRITSGSTFITTISPVTSSSELTSIKPKWDAANVEFGHHVDMVNVADLRFHGGIQYSRISHEYRVRPNLLTFSDTLQMKYYGFGPRIGADFTYHLPNRFAVYAKGATALLIGKQNFHTITAGILDIAGISNGSRTVLVPELEAKLGATYTFKLTQSDFCVDAGYMWQNYFKAQKVLTISHLGGETDFGLYGPYVGLKWVGYV